MTEYVNEKKCMKCDYFTGTACNNSNSDHYGHMLTPWHQTCSQYDNSTTLLMNKVKYINKGDIS